MPRFADAGVDQRGRSAVAGEQIGVVARPGHRTGIVGASSRIEHRPASETIAKRRPSTCELRRYWPRKSSRSPAMPTPVTVARQCWPRACEYSALRVEAVAVLADGASRTRGCDSDRSCTTRAPTIERVRPRSGANDSAARRVGHDFAGIAADEHPFAGLPLELDDVEHVLVGARRRRGEVRRLALDREPRASASRRPPP